MHLCDVSSFFPFIPSFQILALESAGGAASTPSWRSSSIENSFSFIESEMNLMQVASQLRRNNCQLTGGGQHVEYCILS